MQVPIKLRGSQILDGISARLSELHPEATGIRCDHHSISKFGSDNSPGFDLVCAVIQHYVSRAAGSISSCTESRLIGTGSCSLLPIHSATEPRATRGVSSFLGWLRKKGPRLSRLGPLKRSKITGSQIYCPDVAAQPSELPGSQIYYPNIAARRSKIMAAQPYSSSTYPDISQSSSYGIVRRQAFQSSLCPPSVDPNHGTSSRSSSAPSNIALTNNQYTTATSIIYTRPYVCDKLGCENVPGFPSFDGLLRHQREVHKRHDSFQAHTEVSKPLPPRTVLNPVARFDSAATAEEAPAMKETMTAPQAEEGLTKLLNEHRDSPWKSVNSHSTRKSVSRSTRKRVSSPYSHSRPARNRPQYTATDNVDEYPMNAEGHLRQPKSHSFSKDDSPNRDMIGLEQHCIKLPEETGPQANLSRESLYMPNLNATDEERDRAKEEVIRLLRQWTTLGGSRLDSITDPDLAVAREVDAAGRVGQVYR